MHVRVELPRPFSPEVPVVVGGADAVALFTVIETPAEVATLPAASLATAVSTWVPLDAVVVFHDVEYGLLDSALPSGLPSSWSCTLVTPTLSEALADTVSCPLTVLPATGDVIETVGGVESPVGDVALRRKRYALAS